MKNFELKETSLDLVPAICEFRDEMTAHGEKVWDGYYPTLNEDSKAYVERILRRREKPDGDFVPETLLWALHAGKALGRIAHPIILRPTKPFFQTPAFSLKPSSLIS
jgi:hypothetical protein